MVVENGVLKQVTIEDLKLLRNSPDKFWAGVTKIGEYAFFELDDENLTEITIPNGVTQIEKYAFSKCPNLASVKIGDSVTYIGNSAFESCSNLNKLSLSQGLTEIREYAFAHCPNLTTFDFPGSLQQIGGYAFRGTGLKRVIWPGTIQTLPILCFLDCDNLESIIIEEGVKKIEGMVFQKCGNLKEVKLPESLESIGREVFAGCTSLKELHIPKSVNSIAPSALSDTPALEKITVDELNSTYKSVNNCLINQVFHSLVAGCKNSIIPEDEGLVEIQDSAFKECKDVKEIIVPEGVARIGRDAFSGCENATKIVLPSTIKEVWAYAFCGCKHAQITIKNPEKIEFHDLALLGSHYNYLYIEMDEVILTPQQDENLKKEYLEIDSNALRHNAYHYFDKNFRHNLVTLTRLKEAGKIKFIPPEYTLRIFPSTEIDCYYLNKNNKRWKELTTTLGFDQIVSFEATSYLTDLMKIYYAIGGFSRNQGESERAFEYILNHVAMNYKNRKPHEIGEEIHRRFSRIELDGQYNKDFAQFFMRYYKDNADFMSFTLTEGQNMPIDYLCQAHNNFGEMQKLYPNRVVNGNTERELFSPRFVAEHSSMRKYKNVEPGNELLASLIGKYS